MTTAVGPARPLRRRQVWSDLVLLWAFVLLPPAGLMFVGASSMTLGIVCASVLVVAAEALRFRPDRRASARRRRALRMASWAAGAVLLQCAAVSALWGQVDWPRLLGSLVVLILVVLAAACMGERLRRRSSAEATRMFRATTGLLIALAVLSLVAPPIFTPLNHPRPVVVFSEPSFFALAFLPFAGFSIVQLRGGWRWLVAATSLGLALALQSTTLLAGLMFLLLSCLRWRQAALFGALCAAAVLLTQFDTTYIVDRLVFSEDVHNISNLALLQGWERAWLALLQTRGLGLGYQQFGIWGPMGDLQDLLAAVAGANLNLTDGGTTASKIVGEFGLAGIALLVGWLVQWRRAATVLQVALIGPRLPAGPVFFQVCVVTAGIDLWVRGVGYFSLGLFLLGMALGEGRVRVVAPVPRLPRRQEPVSAARLAAGPVVAP